MKIAIASDHAGFRYKEKIKVFLAGAGHEVVDFGTTSEVSVDYPDFIRPAAEAVASGRCERGIVLGGSGNGEAMVANKVRGIRCALCWNEQTAKWAREHNDANMLSIGERTIDEEMAILVVRTWLETPFEGGRHIARIKKIENI
ncbi:MAG: ribose 5-phosphate isomerase B [Candidatus Kapaibacterium sp.]